MADSRRRSPRREENPDLEKLMGNKPPQAIDVEEAVLGALLVEPNCLDDALEDLSDPMCFYNEHNRTIYNTIRDLYNQHNPIDLVTVVEKLSADGKLDEVGGAAYLVELSRCVPSEGQRRVTIASPAVRSGFGPLLGAPKNGQVKSPGS